MLLTVGSQGRGRELFYFLCNLPVSVTITSSSTFVERVSVSYWKYSVFLQQDFYSICLTAKDMDSAGVQLVLLSPTMY